MKAGRGLSRSQTSADSARCLMFADMHTLCRSLHTWPGGTNALVVAVAVVWSPPACDTCRQDRGTHEARTLEEAAVV